MPMTNTSPSLPSSLSPSPSPFPDAAPVPASAFVLAYRAVEAVMLALFPDGHARRAIGFRQISRIMGDPLSWYLWIDDRHGAYQLDLVEHPDKVFPGRADVALRYYPHPSEEGFGVWSPEERRLRESDLFDGTGTPTDRGRRVIDPGLFVCGLLRLVQPGTGDGLVMKVLAQTSWKESILADAAALKDAPRDDLSLRCVPGWALAYPLFDKLVQAWAYVHRAQVKAARTGRMPGMSWVRDRHMDWRLVPDPTVEGRTCAVALSRGAAGLSSMAALTALDAAADRDLREEVTTETVNAPTGAGGWLRPAWWQAHHWAFPPDSQACHSCFAEEEDHHHGH